VVKLVPKVRDVCALDKLGNKVAKSSILETRKFLQNRSEFLGDSISGLPADKADDVDVWYIILDFTFDD
jgi:hypothetical protein